MITYLLSTKQRSGFTLIETLAAIGILIVFLTAALVSFTSTQNLSENTQLQAQALQAAKAKLEEIRAMDFSDLKNWSETPANLVFPITDSYGNTYGMGNIALTDVYANWTNATGAANWSARWAHAAVVYDNKMWVLGGISWAGDLFNDIWYSENGINWTNATGAANWSARYGHAAVVYDNKMWVLGGANGTSTPTYFNDTWYSTDGVNWTQATSAANWPQRFYHAAVVYDNKMWVLGGEKSGGVQLNDSWYSANGINWTNATDAANWSQRANHAAVVYDNKMWILGGRVTMGAFTNDVWYSENGTNWTNATNAANWLPRSGHAAVVYDNKMWVLGGEKSGGVQLNDSWYSANGINWTNATSAASWSNRIAHAAVVYGNKIWVLGGCEGFSDLSDVWWSYGADRMYQVDITVCWRQRNGRIVGEDNGGQFGPNSPQALDGDFNRTIGEGNTTYGGDGDDELDSPVHVTGWLANRGSPSQIYMGRE